jgi:GNAT superfamily N-acetyltransferase
MTADPQLVIRTATRADAPILLELIRGLAEYERLSHLVTTDAPLLERELFAPGANAEAVIGFAGGEPVGFAVYFHNFSTFLGRRGLYLEDLFVQPAHRRHGYGRALLRHVARIAHDRGCGRFEWMALDWNAPAAAVAAPAAGAVAEGASAPSGRTAIGCDGATGLTVTGPSATDPGRRTTSA